MIQGRLALAKSYMAAAQHRQKAYADRKRREVEFELGEQVSITIKMVVT